jgi:hypothetical protein
MIMCVLLCIELNWMGYRRGLIVEFIYPVLLLIYDNQSIQTYM